MLVVSCRNKEEAVCSVVLKLFIFGFYLANCVLENLKKIFLSQKRDILEERMTYLLEGKFITKAVFYVVNFEAGRCTSL